MLNSKGFVDILFFNDKMYNRLTKYSFIFICKKNYQM